MRLTRRAALLGLAAIPAGCTSPNPALYVLAAVPGPVQVGAPATIELRSIGLPHYLERSQIVRSSEDYRMDVLANDWWGEPLDAMMMRILVQELGQRLPNSTVFNGNGAIAATANATVEINLQRFDMDRSGQVLLLAQVAVDARGTHTRSVRFTVRPTEASTTALVAAMSTATAGLADTVAAMLTGH